VLERELKFSPGPSFELPDLCGVVDGLVPEAPVTTKLVAAYYDTPDFRLARAGASVRHRGDEGWTVKLPVSRDDGLARQELHLDGDAESVPEAAIDLVRALVRTAPLELVARLNTMRTKVVVRDETGAAVAEVDDDEVSVIHGARLAARFREVEVELSETADESVAAAIAQRLQQAGAGRPDPVPKIVRAIGPRALDPPDVVPPLELDLASTPLEVLRAAVRSSVARLLDHDPRVRLGDDTEGVHQARVATRRLRSDLRTFRRVVDPHWSEPLRDELKWLGERLGGVRDADVLLERLEARLDALPHADAAGARDLLDTLRAERTEAREALLTAMSSDRYLVLLERLVDATRDVPAVRDVDLHLDGDHDGDHEFDDLDDLDLEAFVAKPWKKLRRAVRDLDDDPADDALHQVRIRAKRVRYAAEAVAPAIGRDAKRFAKRVTEVQDILGEHQDAVVAEQWLREQLRPDSTGPMLFVAGELAAIERAAARTARSRFPAVWRRADRKRLRAWL
jgi:CHAD domain-containing protein